MKNAEMTVTAPHTAYPGTAMSLPPVTDIPLPLVIDDKTLPAALMCPLYTPGYMRTQLGKLMCVEVEACGKLELRTGYLISVGADYILLGAPDGGHTTMCNMRALKFVNIITPHAGNGEVMPMRA
jgi:hypothetical protein